MFSVSTPNYLLPAKISFARRNSLFLAQRPSSETSQNQTNSSSNRSVARRRWTPCPTKLPRQHLFVAFLKLGWLPSSILILSKMNLGAPFELYYQCSNNATNTYKIYLKK